MTARTPGPWRIVGKNSGYINGVDDTGEHVGEVLVAKVGDFFDKELLPFNRARWSADAAFIVTACNAHDTLTAERDRYKALHEHLPAGYAIGDDATAELAVELANTQSRCDRMRKALEEAQNATVDLLADLSDDELRPEFIATALGRFATLSSHIRSALKDD